MAKPQTKGRTQYGQLFKFQQKLQEGVFPFHPNEVCYATITWFVLEYLDLNPIPGSLSSTVFNFLLGVSTFSHLVACGFSAVLGVTILVLLVRFSLTMMLYYKGFLFEEIGKPPSNATKGFMFVISLLIKRAKFVSFQGLMPWMTPPSVDDTIQKYLKTVRPIVDDEKYEEFVRKSEEFKEKDAKFLQNKLWMKWAISKNFISDWWKEVVYMRYRDSLIRTNVGCADVIYQKTTGIQAARAAYVTLLRQYFVREIFESNSMKPVTLGGIPLCAQQYVEYYRTLRVPDEVSDKMIRLPDANHIVVFHKGCWHKLNIFDGGRMINPAELERSLQEILDSKHEERKGERYLGALTAGPRDLWAKTRKEQFGQGLNKESLTAIETALEIVFLDEEEYNFDESDSSAYGKEYERALTGHGHLLWCDKPSIYIFSKNGRFISNAEHSPCDAMVYVQVREYVKYHEQFSEAYDAEGHCCGKVDYVPHAERLNWEFNDKIQNSIQEAYKVSKGVADDFSNANTVFTDFGKELIKKAKVSPDAFIQMALQMAYFKDQGKFELTYEPAVMRLFKEGRTETVRSCSIESCDFVRSMADSGVDNKTKLENLRKACNHHQDYYRSAMAGRGVDRHLFGLYVVSKYYGRSVPFLDLVFSMNYALSTSQTPQHQMAEYAKALNKDPSLFWPAGGFCCPDGSNYGVCYTLSSSGDRMSFHVTTWKSLNNTDAHRFLGHIVDSLNQIRRMVEGATA